MPTLLVDLTAESTPDAPELTFKFVDDPPPPDLPDDYGGDDDGLIRLIVLLTPRAYQALLDGGELSGDNLTDTFNRAMHLYARAMELAETKEGGTIRLENADGKVIHVTII